ncbi:MAG: SynChlorMet cassette protein ScmC [Candidatus Methylomirabilia bacterium]
MNPPPPPGLERGLSLADGSRWVIAAGDEAASSIVSRLGRAMRLGVVNRTGAVEPNHHGAVRRLLVRVGARDRKAPAAACHPTSPSESDNSVVCVLRPFPHGDGLYCQLMELSSVFAREAQARGGVLLHGALAERGGIGVILAAPGGTGKTTASVRLPAPWRSLCDDTTLVVRDSRGRYRAHPWPTWSRFMHGEPGGAWDVQEAVPLGGVFFLSRAVEDRAEPVGTGRAVGLLVECAGQGSQSMALGLGREATRALHLERFGNLCDLARAVPTRLLHISLAGAFWQEIERSMDTPDDPVR